MRVPIVGPSYALDAIREDSERAVNMYPVTVESPGGKTTGYLATIPGLVQEYALGAEVRGYGKTQNRVFAVAGNTLFELFDDGTNTARGTLSTSTGPVEIQRNLFQIIVTDGNGYVLTLATNAFQQISDPAFAGSQRVAVLNGRAVFTRLDTRTFYWSAIDDALTYDPLDFASAESTSDNIVAPFVDHGQLYLFKLHNLEVWAPSSSGDTAFERNDGAHIETGCAAAFTICALDNTVYWLGQDERGTGVVWKLSGYTPMRVSNHALEQALTGVDLSGARAYAYQQGGRSFYVLQVPGLSLTPAYDVESGKWCDRAELVDGEWQAHRGLNHIFAFEKHLIGATDGKIYSYDPEQSTNAGAVLARDRIFRPFPNGDPRQPFFIARIELDCTVGSGLSNGVAALLLMRISKDGGEEYGNWRTTDLGVVGQRQRRVFFLRGGMVKDRTQLVIHFRVTDNVEFAILGCSVE